MNNSQFVLEKTSLSLEEPVNRTETLREREAILVRIIEAIVKIEQSEEWSTLKNLIFDSTVESLEKRLKNESESLIVNVPQINQLQGQLIWARKYIDLHKLAEGHRLELANIRKITQPTER